MPDLDVLRELMNDDTLVLASNDRHGRNILVLEEPQEQPPYLVTIRSVPDHILAIKADKFPPPAFRGDRGERKRADFVIFATGRARNWIVYVEMKGARSKRSRSRSGIEIRQQLMGAMCLVGYCRKIGRIFWRQPNFLEERDYQERFVGVTDIGIDKRPTRTRSGSLHDRPENMLRINADPLTVRFASSDSLEERRIEEDWS